MKQCNLRNYKRRKNCERDTRVDESLRSRFSFVFFLATRDFWPLTASKSKLKFVIEVLRNYVFVMF